MVIPKPTKRQKLKKRPRRRRRGKQASLATEADISWSRIVRHRGHCEVQHPVHECKLALQAMHGIPRTYRATRWLPINGFAGCQGIHMYYTRRPEEWSAYLLEAWGPEVYRELWRKARSHQKPDLEGTVQALRLELYHLEGLPPLREVV